jgi:hypothetical protein
LLTTLYATGLDNAFSIPLYEVYMKPKRSFDMKKQGRVMAAGKKARHP